MDHASGHETERHRDEAIEQDEAEGVEERLDEFRFAQDGRVVREPDPRRRPDAIPAVQRVLHRQGERLEHEHSIHQERGEHEQPADQRLPADPRCQGDPPTVPPTIRRVSGLGNPLPRSGLVGGVIQRFNSFSYSAWTALSKPAASCLPPTSFWSSGVQPWAKMDPVAFAMKSIAPLSLATSAPVANVSLVTEPVAAGGTARSVGPPGFEPPMLTSI